MSIRQSYGQPRRLLQHPVSGAVVAGTALAAAIGAWQADWRFGPALASVAWLLARSDPRPVRVFLLVGVIATLAGVRGAQAERSLVAERVGPYEGWATIVDEPQPYPSSTRVILEIEGQRFETWTRGRAARLRVEQWRAGEMVRVVGERDRLDDERQGRVSWQHVVGEFQLDHVTDRLPGGPIDRASNRVRAAIEHGAATLPGDDGALFRGLVVGDDRDQPREMIERFRASGLSHLTAVSGQNVSFLLAAAGPMLVLLRPWWRWMITLGLIAWFVSLTRFEPSIVRAGVMAMLSATAFVLGRERGPARILAMAVTALVLVDPLLVGSVGFWLSVGATAGVTTVGPWLAARLDLLGFMAMPVGITLGAQVGVVLPVVLVFGRLPLVSIPANLLAVPVAGFVMLYGLPAGLLAGWVPPLATVVMLPCRVGVRWVDTVATLGARLEPGGTPTWIGWVLVVVGVVALVVRSAGATDAVGAGR